MIDLVKIAKLYMQNRKSWEDICNCCGKCCYEREIDESGNLITDFDQPCEYLDPDTKLCIVYENRFEACDRCGKVGLRAALFNKYLPHDCAYARLFRE